MKNTHRYIEKYRYIMSICTPWAEERPAWLSEYDKGVNDGKVWRYDYVFWSAVIFGLCFLITCVGLGLLASNLIN
jgi:hypothetical protein